MHRIAKERGGRCLSNKYINVHTKLKWKCAEGHQWEAQPSHIKTGTWCPYCNRNVKLTIEEMQKIAKSRGGKCLSDVYINANTKLLWECAEGHQWHATPSKIKQGKWCPYCAGRHITIEDMRIIATKRGGKCLSDKYINSTTKLLWECSVGHKWTAMPLNVKRGSWCPHCFKQRKKSVPTA